MYNNASRSWIVYMIIKCETGSSLVQDYEEDFEEELESSSGSSEEEEEEEEDEKRGVSITTREVEKGREKMDLMEIMQAIDAENQMVGPAVTGSAQVDNSQEAG